MTFKLGFGTGFAVGYYFGSKAGRQRYEQINQALRKLRRSDAIESATEKAKSTVGESVEKAKSVVESKVGDGKAESTADDLAPPRFG